MERQEQIKSFYEEVLIRASPDGQGGQSGDHTSTRVSEPGVRQRWTGLLSHMSWKECPSRPHA